MQVQVLCIANGTSVTNITDVLSGEDQPRDPISVAIHHLIYDIGAMYHFNIYTWVDMPSCFTNTKIANKIFKTAITLGTHVVSA